MKNSTWKNYLLVLGLSLCIASLGGSVANAEETMFYQKPNAENALKAAGSVRSSPDELTISNENSKLIEEAINLDNSNKEYIDTVISNFKTDISTNSTDLNTMITDSVSQLISSSKQSKVNFQQAITKEQEIDSNSKNSRFDPILAARTAYRAGAALVSSKGGPQTSWYMLHAEVPFAWSANPSNVTHNNDAWSKKVATDNGFNAAIYSRFYNEVYGKQSATLTDRHKFTVGDPFYALANVTYNVTFNRLSNGGYRATYKITDIYDFDWGNYENISVGFGNNYCMAMQKLGLIKPFNISIIYNG